MRLPDQHNDRILVSFLSGPCHISERQGFRNRLESLRRISTLSSVFSSRTELQKCHWHSGLSHLLSLLSGWRPLSSTKEWCEITWCIKETQ